MAYRRKHTDELLGDHIPSEICSVSGEGTMRGKGGPITAAIDVPGGPILAGDHRRRDKRIKKECDLLVEDSEPQEFGEEGLAISKVTPRLGRDRQGINLLYSAVTEVYS